MKENRQRSIYWRLLALASLLMVGIFSALFYFHLRSQTAMLEQISRQQQQLTSRIASGMEHALWQVQSKLEQLAHSPLPEASEDRTVLATYYEEMQEFPQKLVQGLVLHDRQGKIFAAYPANGTIDAAIIDLVTSSKDLSAAHVSETFMPDGPTLLLSHALENNRPTNGLIVSVLISLQGFRENCLLNSNSSCNFAFILDQSGRFLLHRDTQQTGRQFGECLPSNERQEAINILGTLEQGQPCSLPPNDALTDSVVQGGSLLTLVPFQAPGGNWTLGMSMPVGILAGLDQSNVPFIAVIAIGLFVHLLVSFPWLRRRWCIIPAGTMIRPPHLEQVEKEKNLAIRRYQHVLDNAGDAIFFIDPRNGNLLEMNRRAEELFGYSAGEVQSIQQDSLFPGNQRRRFLRLMRQVLKDGYGEDRSLLFRRKDGRTFVGAVHARLGDLGEEKVVHASLRDISEMRRIEQELRQKNKDLTLVNKIAHRAAGSHALHDMLLTILDEVIENFASDGGGIFRVTQGGKILELAVQRGISPDVQGDLQQLEIGMGLAGRVVLTGHPRSSVDIRKDQRLYSQAVKKAGWRGVQAVPLSANAKTVGVMFIFSSNKRLFTRDEVQLLLAIGKQVGTAVDSAELFEALRWQNRLTRASNRELEHSRQQLRETLQQTEKANRELAQLDRMKSKFLALASHELRTPLTCVMAGTELLQSQIGNRLNDDEINVLDAIEQGGKRLQGIVQDLLEMARLEAQKVYLAREVVQIPALITQVVQEFEPVISRRSLSLLAADLQKDLVIFGDPHHLKNTLARLVENAVKFTPEGGCIEILTDVWEHGEILRQQSMLQNFTSNFFDNLQENRYVLLTVKDSGVGIDPEEQLRIFEKFYESGDVETHFTSHSQFGGKGVGLGLTLVKGIVEAHGGMVWVESPGNEGNGSAFRVLLPLAPAEELPPPVLAKA